jgi:hypothetical protein
MANYILKCECESEQKVNQSFSKLIKCKKCGIEYKIGNYFKPYKLVETTAELFEDLSQKKGNKNSQVPVEVRNKINKILGRKCDYTDKRKNYYSMKWYANHTNEERRKIAQIPEVRNLYWKEVEDYSKNIPSFYKKPYIRVHVEKLKGEQNGI